MKEQESITGHDDPHDDWTINLGGIKPREVMRRDPYEAAEELAERFEDSLRILAEID